MLDLILLQTSAERADKKSMSTSPIPGPVGSVQAVLTSALQKVGLAATAGAVQQQDSAHVSATGQALGALQQLQQSDPAEYKHVTQQIAATLKSAAQEAQQAGNLNEANQLIQLSTGFTHASGSGQ
jgi:hypothetical protein